MVCSSEQPRRAEGYAAPGRDRSSPLKISETPTATTVRSPAAASDVSAMPVSVSAMLMPD